MFHVTVAPLNRSGSSPSDSVRLRPVTVAISDSTRVRAFQSCTSRKEAPPRSTPFARCVVWSETSRPGSRKGSGRIATVSTTLKMVLLTPMPSARQTMVSAANPGFLIRVRAA